MRRKEMLDIIINDEHSGVEFTRDDIRLERLYLP